MEQLKIYQFMMQICTNFSLKFRYTPIYLFMDFISNCNCKSLIYGRCPYVIFLWIIYRKHHVVYIFLLRILTRVLICVIFNICKTIKQLFKLTIWMTEWSRIPDLAFIYSQFKIEIWVFWSSLRAWLQIRFLIYFFVHVFWYMEISLMEDENLLIPTADLKFLLRTMFHSNLFALY